MPYRVARSPACPDSQPYAVLKQSGGKPLGCHASKGKAQRQVAALYANEKELTAIVLDLAEAEVLLARLEEGGKYRRPLLPAEKFVDLAAIDRGMDQAKDDLVARLAPIQRSQAEAMVKAAQPYLERGVPVDIVTLPSPLQGEMSEAILELMLREYARGRAEVTKEATKARGAQLIAEPIPEQPEGRIVSIFRAKANALTGVFTTRLQASLSLILNRYLGVEDVRYGDVLTDLLKTANAEVLRNAGEVAIDPFQVGREKEAFERGAKTAIYSALLDAGTCSSCEALDGKEFETGSSEYWENEPPNRKCDWPPNCRCTYVWEFGEAYWRGRVTA